MLKIGSSCADITPPVGTTIVGFADRQPSSIGVHDSLKAISLVFSDHETTLALISCDLANIDDSLARTIKEEVKMRTGVQESQIAIACSHTHYGPAVNKHNFYFDQTNAGTSYRSSLKFYLAGSIIEALTNMHEASLGVGWGTSNIGVNRRERQPDGRIELGQNLEKLIDQQVGVAKFCGTDNNNIACVVNFACHPVSQSRKMRLVSADYPGKMREVVKTLTGDRCLFLQGACGNINPVLMDHAYEPARKLGTQLGCEVVKIWENIETFYKGSLEEASESIIIPRYNYGSKDRAEELVANLEETIKTFTSEGAVEGLINWAKIRYKNAVEALESWNTGKSMPEVKAEIQAWKVGDLGIVFVPGEVFNEIGAYIKNHSPFPDTFFVGCANGNIGYIPTSKEYAEGGYEVNEACQVGPEADTLITEKCLELLERLYES